MLRSLVIRDYAIIDALEIDLGGGFTVLSGETGAGKSILIDALGLLLGDRAEGGVVRQGRERAELTAEFDLGRAPAAQQWLEAQELGDADEPDRCRLRRVIGADGRSRAFINAAAVTLGQLRELGERLVEIHGQHEHQTLTQPATQRSLLDDSGVDAALLAAVAQAQAAHHEAGQALERARALAGRDPGQLDYLRAQVRELERLNLAADELPRLDEEHRRLSNAGRLMGEGAQAQELLLGGDNSLHDQLNQVETLLLGLAELHADFGEAQTLVAQARMQTREAADGLRRLLDRMDLDPDRLAEVEQRLSAIHELARKHRLRPEELPARRLALQEESALLEQAVGGLDALQQRQDESHRRWRAAAARLTDAREKCAAALSPQVTRRLRDLGMPQAQFGIAIQTDADAAPRASGADEVRFEFSANPGQPARALGKVASGGELSRLSLAIQVCVRGASAAPTLIFDEVDAGIGGVVAHTVGAQLHELAAHAQVLCVTHLPQVAARGDAHLGIAKQVRGGQTLTSVQPLEGAARVGEIARMLGGGAPPTAATKTLAQELLEARPARKPARAVSAKGGK